MVRWSDKVRYQGRTVNRGTLAIMDAANVILRSKRFGSEREPVTLIQGSYNYGVSASAGTHNGGGAGDITGYNWRNREFVFRILGCAMYNRPRIRGLWNHHMHFIVDGDGTASAGAKRQVVAYHKRRNALASNGPDVGPRMLSFPLFVAPWKPEGKTGVLYVARRTPAFSQPNFKSRPYRTLKPGVRFNVVARVRTGNTYWAINPNGLVVPVARLEK